MCARAVSRAGGGPDIKPAAAEAIDRRTFLLKAGTAGIVACGALVVGGFTALVGRLIPSSPGKGTSAPLNGSTPPSTPTPPSSVPSTTGPAPTPTSGAPAGTAIGPASAVPVGEAASFSDPYSGDPANVVHTSSGYKAFSALCTHAGCTVRYAGNDLFRCPCHGAEWTPAMVRSSEARPNNLSPLSPSRSGLMVSCM